MSGMERKRKRKKVHNNNNSNHNESSESEGDSENEQHNEFDNEYLDFLKDFFNPTQTASVSSMDINDDEEADPEYNIREDDLEDHDREELRRDRAVKISKKELNELLAELKTIEGFDFRNDDEQEEDSQQQEPVGISQDQSLQTPKKIDNNMMVSFENSNNNNNKNSNNDDITTVCTNTIRNITSTNTNTTSTSTTTIVTTTSQSINQKEKEKEVQQVEEEEEEEAFSPRTLGLIQYQLQQHIQQLAQTYVLTATCSEECMKKMSVESKSLIIDLNNRAEAAGPKSLFSVKNIKLAKDLINSWPVNVMFKSPIKKKILEERYMNENQIDKGDGKIFPRNIVKVIAENPLFMYPELLPLSPNLQSPIRVNFTLNEDALIAVALNEMQSERYENFKTREKAKLIGTLMLPGRPVDQIFHRIKNVRKTSKTDDAAAISACCLKKFFVEKTIPPSPTASWTLDLLNIEPTAPIHQFKLPVTWGCLVKKLKLEYPFTEYLSTTRNKKRKMSHGIKGNITGDISCTDSNDSTSTEGNEDLQNSTRSDTTTLKTSNKNIKNAAKVVKSKKVPLVKPLKIGDDNQGNNNMETERFPILNIHGEPTAYIFVPKLYVRQKPTEQEVEEALFRPSTPLSSPSSCTSVSPNISSSSTTTTINSTATPSSLNISCFTPRKNSEALIETPLSSNKSNNNNTPEKQKQQSNSVVDSQKKIINTSCSSSSSSDKIVNLTPRISSSMPLLSVKNERVATNSLYSISHSLESPLKNRENYLKVSLENKQKQQQQLLLKSNDNINRCHNNDDTTNVNNNRCRQDNSARTWLYERKSLHEINETILKKLQNESLDNNTCSSDKKIEETDEYTSSSFPPPHDISHDMPPSPPEVINLCTRDGFEEEKVPVINKQEQKKKKGKVKINLINSPAAASSSTTTTSICTSQNSTPIKRLILQNMMMVKKEIVTSDNDDSLMILDSSHNSTAGSDVILANEGENIIPDSNSNNNKDYNKINEDSGKYKTNSNMTNGSSTTTNNNNSNRKSKTPTRVEKNSSGSTGEASGQTGGDGHDDGDDEDEDDDNRRNRRKRKNNEPEDKKDTDMDHKEEIDSDGDDEDNLKKSHHNNIEEDFNNSPPLRNDLPSNAAAIATKQLEESDDNLASQKKKARKIKRSPVGSNASSSNVANTASSSGGGGTSNVSNTKKRVTKYNTTEMQKLLDDADSEIDIEQIETAFAEEFWSKLQHTVDQNLYNTILQVFVDFGERNAPEQELFSKVKDMLKDFPELLLDFVTMVDPQSCETFDLFQDNSQIQAQIRFMHLLEKLSLHCPQLKTRILQKLRYLRDLEKLKENDVMEVVELYFQGNKVMSDAFKALFPTIFRPETNMRQEDFEEVNLDDDSGVKSEEGAPPLMTTTALTTSAVEVINLPEEPNVPATNSCPCDCHLDTKNVSTMYTTKAKHCQKCCLRFLPDGKVFLNSGRNMKQVNVSYVDSKEKAELIINRKNCPDCFEPFKVPESPKRKSARKSTTSTSAVATTTTTITPSTTNTITATSTTFSSVSSCNITPNRANRLPPSSNNNNVNNSDGMLKKQTQQQVPPIHLKSLKPVHVAESSPPPTTGITTIHAKKDNNNTNGKIPSTNLSSEIESTNENDKNDSGDLEDGEILDDDDDNAKVDNDKDGDLKSMPSISACDQIASSNRSSSIPKDATSSPMTTTTTTATTSSNLNTSKEKKLTGTKSKKITSANTSLSSPSSSSSSSGSSPSTSTRNKPSPKVPTVWTLEEDRAILITCQQEQSLEAAFERLKKVLPNRALPAIRIRFSELMAILEKVKEGDRGET